MSGHGTPIRDGNRKCYRDYSFFLLIYKILAPPVRGRGRARHPLSNSDEVQMPLQEMRQATMASYITDEPPPPGQPAGSSSSSSGPGSSGATRGRRGSSRGRGRGGSSGRGQTVTSSSDE